MNKYFLVSEDKRFLELYNRDVRCDCWVEDWENVKENRAQLLKLGYIKAR